MLFLIFKVTPPRPPPEGCQGEGVLFWGVWELWPRNWSNLAETWYEFLICISVLIFKVTLPLTPPLLSPGGELGGARGGFSPILPKIMSYIDSGVFNSGEFKNDLYFHFRVPPIPARAPTGGVLGGAEGGLVLYYQKSFLISILGFSKVEISKMISILILGYPKPPQGRPRGGGLGGQRRYTTKIQVSCQFWGFNSGELKIISIFI